MSIFFCRSQIVVRCTQTHAAAPPVAVLDQNLRDIRNFIPAKGSAVLQAPLAQPGLPRNELDHLADGHAGGEAMGVHDEVGTDARVRERHVLLGNWTDGVVCY